MTRHHLIVSIIISLAAVIFAPLASATYSVDAGRWIERDPVVSLPNQYGYVRGAPADFVDPMGLFRVPARPMPRGLTTPVRPGGGRIPMEEWNPRWGLNNPVKYWPSEVGNSPDPWTPPTWLPPLPQDPTKNPHWSDPSQIEDFYPGIYQSPVWVPMLLPEKLPRPWEEDPDFIPPDGFDDCEKNWGDCSYWWRLLNYLKAQRRKPPNHHNVTPKEKKLYEYLPKGESALEQLGEALKNPRFLCAVSKHRLDIARRFLDARRQFQQCLEFYGLSHPGIKKAHIEAIQQGIKNIYNLQRAVERYCYKDLRVPPPSQIRSPN